MNYFIFFLLSNFNLQTADSIVFIEKEINIEAEQIYADHFDNIYIVSENTIFKYNSDAVKLAEYSSEIGEEISDIDCQNPFKIIVSYTNQNKFIILDNALTQISVDVYFDDIKIPGEALITHSYDSGYKIFDKTESILYKTDTEFNIEFHRDLFLDDQAVKIRNNKNIFAFLAESGKVFLYDNETYDKSYIIENIGSFTLFENTISYFNKNKKSLTFTDVNNPLHSKKEMFFPAHLPILDAILGNRKVFSIDKSSVYIGTLPSMEE